MDALDDMVDVARPRRSGRDLRRDQQHPRAPQHGAGALRARRLPGAVHRDPLRRPGDHRGQHPQHQAVVARLRGRRSRRGGARLPRAHRALRARLRAGRRATRARFLRVTGAGGTSPPATSTATCRRGWCFPDEPAPDRSADLAHPPRREPVQRRRADRRRSRAQPERRSEYAQLARRRSSTSEFRESRRDGDLDELAAARGADRAARSAARDMVVARAGRDRRRRLRRHDATSRSASRCRTSSRRARRTSSTIAIRAASRIRTSSSGSTR